MNDYYEILGVPKNASKEAIKQAYRSLAHKFHPDKQGGDEKKFKEINEAYQVLGDERKRAQFDQFGSAGGWQGAGGFSGFQGFDFGNFDFHDVFSEFFGGGTRTSQRVRARGRDIEVDFVISLEEAFSGIEKEISLKKYMQCQRCDGKKNEPGTNLKKCETCGGSGEIRSQQRTFIGFFTQISICATCRGEGKIPEKKCEKCRGAGRIQDIESTLVKIPAGIRSGEVLELYDKGEMGDGGSGNLYIKVHVKDHSKFVREEDDIISQVEISMSQAALGDSLHVKTLEGGLTVNIPSGIESAEMVKLPGKGMPRVRRAGRGDHYVKIIVKTPKRLTSRERELFLALRKEGM